ncbi:MAG: EFR1 family ferrodoxin [Candidatus Eremiobacteraeota bacterium]|nr:EFR1 family ferrodoxin [Candidatus Eremiobacteraeota bacterium]
MSIKTIDFYFFSGSGNTYLVVKEMADLFKEEGMEVNLFRIENVNPEDFDSSHTIGIGFPVAAQSTYKFIWDFFEKLPDAQGTEIFMVDTLAQISGGLVGPMKKLLQKRGYKTIGSKEIKMPGNWFPGEINETKNKELISGGLKEAREYAKSLIDGQAEWKSQSFFSDLICSVSRSGFAWNFFAKMGKKFQVDRDKCKQCNICIKLCPIGNIEMNDYPEFLGKCQQCMRCISLCPTEAIYMKGKNSDIYRAVKAGELLKI